MVSAKVKISEEPPQKQTQNDYNLNLENRASFISKALFLWTNKVIKLGNSKIIKENDLFDLREEERLEKVLYELKKAQQINKNKGFSYAIFKTCQKEFLITSLFTILVSGLSFAGPIFLNLIIKNIADPFSNKNEGYLYSSLLFGCFILKAFLTQHLTLLTNRITFQSCNQILGIMYEKLLKLSNTGRKYMDPGKMTNLVIMNTMEILQFFLFAFTALTAPFIIIAASVYIIYELDYVGIIAPFMLALSAILVNHITSKQADFRMKVFSIIDQRSKKITEFFQGIKIIKYYAWEKWVVNQLQNIRLKEMKILFGFLFNIGQVDCISQVSPSIIAVLVFVIYILLDNQLNAAKAFTALSLINLLQSPIIQLVSGWGKFIQARVSYNRIAHFLDSEEQPQDYYDEELMKNCEQGEIMIEEGFFSWESEKNEMHNLKNPDDDYMKKMQIKFIQKEIQSKKKAKEDVKQLEDALENLKQKKIAEVPKISPNLTSINLHYKPNTFNAIYGIFSSGKTTLAHAIINEINKLSGKIAVKGSIAYVPQIPWLRSCSLRDNILFGEEYNQKRYEKTLRICQLLDDIKQLPGGDLTEIGERGVNLSGGQKQRISVARAVYSNRDIYVVDDCLSALDSHVGRLIFKKVFYKFLKQKTIIFITHHTHYMKYFDTITILKEGKVADFGSYSQLTAKNSEALSYLLNNEKSQVQKAKEGDELDDQEGQNNEINDELSQNNKIPHNPPQLGKAFSEQQSQFSKMSEEASQFTQSQCEQPNQGQDKENEAKGMLVQSEEKAVGSVPFFVYKEYFLLGGLGYVTIALLIFAISQAGLMLSDWWLGQWSQNAYTELDNNQYAGIYAGVSITSGLLYIFRYLAFLVFSIRISKSIFRNLLVRLLQSPMEFFDKTPLGRIVTRFSKDIDAIDYMLQLLLQQLISGVMTLIGSFVMISLITPIFIAVAVFILICYYFILRRQIKCSREIKRIVDNIRAPLIGVYTELNQGLLQIRGLNKEKFFFKTFSKCVDGHTRSTFNEFFCNHWLNLITDLFSSIIVAASAYLGLAQKEINGYDIQLAAHIGLSLTWALRISSSLPVTIRFVGDTELQMNSFHRILNYINETPQERDFEILSETNQAKTLEKWPQQGDLELENVSYRYRKETPIVLKNITLSIKANEKIGVIGRTGSGKSTLTLGLLRILELVDEENSKILLNGQNIAKIGLNQLRSNVSMIPQDPVLFQGTIRSNVDPFEIYTDTQVVDALKKVQLWETLLSKANPTENKDNSPTQNPKIITAENIQTQTLMNGSELNEKSIKNVLDLKVDSQGANFSQGEKQLIALSRVIVRKCKLLLMDEATASIDEKTDWIIQNMIRSEFQETTIITIAHRLKTIIQYDRILVLSDGEIKEFDSPKSMLNNPNSYLLKLIRENGKEHEADMRRLAYSN
ncbi:ABC transporter C family protein (macronuclear) [Tetrahymena thermophila SB210]|uniref:ABC transporter C family protein n=1 Tax=Tetrahymena thermophila (strain SB210) TaxID=312017 RepID=I7MKL7_TETTS|nr:ABC transporter C family protein [Tetrahymena thermophila SB210]EAR99522.1 ABC transporter C family protein [Tetrahymena thermophila SB210]|eukprot:XP_001019767.1 ABC transporter C family protein [Tetrahymena thermophila SB210]